METTWLGTSDLRVPRVGIGTVTFGGHWGPMEASTAVATVRRALDLGLTFFDTADCYGFGSAEETLARALGRRLLDDDVVVSSKFGVRWDSSGRTWRDISPRYVREALEGSLRRLRVERIPLYYVHWPDGVTPIEDTVGELSRCRDEGKIGWIGLSNPSASELERAAQVTPIAAVQFQSSLVDQGVARQLLPGAMRFGIGTVAWGSLVQGLLAGTISRTREFAPTDRRARDTNFRGARFEHNLRVADRLVELARQAGRKPSDIALRWLLDVLGMNCALAGPKSPEQVDDYTGALDWQLDQGLRDELTALAECEPLAEGDSAREV